MNKINQLMVSFAAVTPKEWWEDDDGFIVAESKEEPVTVADPRIDERYADANVKFILLVHQQMPNILEALQVLHKMSLVDERGDDAFFLHGPEARSALRKLGIKI